MVIDSTMERTQYLQKLHQRCEDILKYARKFADSRWQEPIEKFKTGYFRDSAEYSAGPHIVNTSTALFVIARNPSVFELQKVHAFEQMKFKNICEYFSDTYDSEKEGWPSRESHWGPYVSSWALLAISNCGKFLGKDKYQEQIPTKGKLANAIVEETKALLTFLENWVKGDLQYDKRDLRDFEHAFFVYTSLKALYEVIKLHESYQSVLSKDEVKRYQEIESQVVGKLALAFFRQMTFGLADIPHHLDAVSLIVSLFCILEYAIPSYEISEEVLNAAMETIFKLQRPTGFWDTGSPLLGSSTGLVGCSSVELALCLLRNLRTSKYFRQYVDNFNKLLSFLHLSFNESSPEEGWPTDIRRRDTGRQTWYGFMVFEFLKEISNRLRDLAAEDLLRDFERHEEAPEVKFDSLLDYLGYKKKLAEYFIKPRALVKEARTTEDIKKIEKNKKYSAILFGPPGTGKTSIAHALADNLKYRFVEIGPGDFLKHGIDGVFAQGDEIFRRLMLADNAVVLFDELDELVLQRKPGEDKLSRFLTTYMLPWLQRLRSKKEVIFLFTTNNIDYFDQAIKRVGRFDIVLPIGPPQGEERIKWLKKINVNLPDDKLKSLVNMLPFRATLGEIKCAWERIRHVRADNIIKQMVNELDHKRLLISAEEWGEFRKQRAPYIDGLEPKDRDRDEDSS